MNLKDPNSESVATLVDLMEDGTQSYYSAEFLATDIDSAKKACLIEGIDDIGLTLNKVGHISEFENKQKSMNPWLYSQKLK